MLLNILQCTGPPPQQKIIWPKMSIVLRLRNPALKQALKKMQRGIIQELKWNYKRYVLIQKKSEREEQRNKKQVGQLENKQQDGRLIQTSSIIRSYANSNSSCVTDVNTKAKTIKCLEKCYQGIFCYLRIGKDF